MHILIVSQYFYPENFKVNDIAFDFVRRGHEVTVLTGKPNYPTGKFFKGYGFFKKRKEKVNGVNIVRTSLFPRMNGSGKFLALNYLSFLFFSFFTIHFRMSGKYDVVFSHLPSPLTSAIPGIWLKKKFKCPLVIWVLDLWPDSVTANSSIKGGTVIKLLDKIVNYIYQNSDKILISSQRFRESIESNFDVQDSKLVYFPNWAEDVFTNVIEKEEKKLPEFPKGFNVVFAGNLGDSQGFESVIEAAKISKEMLNWVLVGDGRKADWIREQKSMHQLDNVYLLGRFPLEMMPHFFKKSDAMLVSLKDDPNFSLTVPAKVQAYMASGKIILGMLNGEGKQLINNSGCGLASDAADYKGLVENALKIRMLSSVEKKEIEELSTKFYQENFAKNMLFLKLENIFKMIDRG